MVLLSKWTGLKKKVKRKKFIISFIIDVPDIVIVSN